MTEKIDIFKVLPRIDLFDLDYFNGLTTEEKKAVPPYTLMLWLAGCTSDIQIRQINTFLNPVVFSLPAAHRDIMYKLACIASDGKKKRYKWIKKTTKSKQYSNSVDVLTRHFKCSRSQALDYIPLIDCDYVITIAQELGEQDDTLKKIKKEFK